MKPQAGKVYTSSREAQLYLTSREGIPSVCLWNRMQVKVPLYPAAKARETEDCRQHYEVSQNMKTQVTNP